MQNVSELNEFKNDDPAWCIIAEYSLSEDIKAELRLKSINKTLRDLGVQPECLNKLEEAIAGIPTGARIHPLGGGPSLPTLIRLFCQRASVDSLSHIEKYRNGGWGFYLIEKDADSQDISCQERPRVVELYLYKEGE